MTQLRNRWKPTVALAGILAALVWAGCNDGEEIEPGTGEGLSIALSPFVVCSGTTSEVQVTFFDQRGAPIVGEEITLAVTPITGSLSACTDPTPCTTDSAGQVTSTFSSSTPDTYTLVATGGTVTSAALLSVVDPGTGTLTLEPTPPTDKIFTTCSPSLDTIPVSGDRKSSPGVGISGALVSLEVVSSAGGLGVAFLSVPVYTTSTGSYSATLVPVISSADCTACAAIDCSVTVRAVSDCVAFSPDLKLTESF